MSSAEILAQIHALKAKITKLYTAISYLNMASTSFGKFPRVLRKIGFRWFDSIRIEGRAADKGKAFERAAEFEGFKREIRNIIDVINAKIAEYENEIVGLLKLYWIKKAEEEAAAAKATAAAGAKHPSGIIYDLTSSDITSWN